MSKGTYSYSNRHRMHENRETPCVIHHARNMGKSLLTKAQRDAWNAMSEIDKLKRENEELKRTLSKSMYALQENEELKRELEECRESYQVLADDYLRLRGLMKRDSEILDYILSDDTNAEVYIQGMLCLALSRDEMEKVMREDPHHPAD